MTEAVEYSVIGDTPSTWVPTRHVGALASATIDTPGVSKFIQRAVVMGTVAAVMSPLPVAAGRQKYGEVEQGFALAEEAPVPAQDIIDEQYAFHSSFENNLSSFETSGVLYKLQGGGITMRQQRVQKTSNGTSARDPAPRWTSYSSRKRTWQRTASTSGPFRALVELPSGDDVCSLFTTDKLLAALQTVNSADLSKDALAFADTLRELPWQPEVWADESEVVFEWINDGQHAVVSIEGDGHLGYTMLINGQFRSGIDTEASVTHLPRDLQEYLNKQA